MRTQSYELTNAERESVHRCILRVLSGRVLPSKLSEAERDALVELDWKFIHSFPEEEVKS